MRMQNAEISPPFTPPVVQNSVRLEGGGRRRFHFLFSIILFIGLSSCIFFSGDYDDLHPPEDFAFIHHGTAPPILATRNSTLYDIYAFSSDASGMLAIYNVIYSHNPYLLSQLQLPTNQTIRKIEVDWRLHLYIAAGSAGVYIVDASSPSYPTIANDYTSINAQDISLQEDYLAITDDAGWKLMYISSSSQLSEINSYRFFDSRQPERILLRNNWVYVFSRYDIDIFDITNIYNIQHEGSFNFFYPIIDFDIIGNFIALLTTNDLIYIDISNPLFAYIASEFGLAWTPRTMSVRDNMLFISWDNRSLSAYQVWGVHQLPTENARINLSYAVQDIDFKDDLIYLSMGGGGLQIFYYME